MSRAARDPAELARLVAHLEPMVKGWERTVRDIVERTPQYYNEYLNDMDGRELLQDALDAIPPDEQGALRARVAAADATVLPHLVPTAHCIWGDHVARAQGYTPERDWWYFHRPPNEETDWPPEWALASDG
jgi:hypothetical protein